MAVTRPEHFNQRLLKAGPYIEGAPVKPEINSKQTLTDGEY